MTKTDLELAIQLLEHAAHINAQNVVGARYSRAAEAIRRELDTYHGAPPSTPFTLLEADFAI